MLRDMSSHMHCDHLVENYFMSFMLVIDVVTRLLGGCSGVWIPVGAQNFSVHQNVRTGSGAHPASYSVCTVVLPWGKAARA
jgi:hypothetical protein